MHKIKDKKHAKNVQKHVGRASQKTNAKRAHSDNCDDAFHNRIHFILVQQEFFQNSSLIQILKCIFSLSLSPFFLKRTPYAIVCLYIAFFDSHLPPLYGTLPAMFAKSSSNF